MRFFRRGEAKSPGRTEPGAGARVSVPWVRTRLRTAPGAACALALLVGLTACLAAAFPRAVDRYEDTGLRRAAEQARPDRSGIEVYAPPPSPMDTTRMREDALRPQALASQYAEIRAQVPAPLVVDRDQSSYGVRTSENLEAPDPWLPMPTGKPPQVALVAQSDLVGHSSVAQGRLPRADDQVTSRTSQLEAAVTAETAKSLHIKVGSVIHAGSYTVRVTGIVTPRAPRGAYWSKKTILRTPALLREPIPSTDMYWVGALLLSPKAAPALLAGSGKPERYWQLAPEVRTLRARDLRPCGPRSPPSRQVRRCGRCAGRSTVRRRSSRSCTAAPRSPPTSTRSSSPTTGSVRASPRSSPSPPSAPARSPPSSC